ncbi:DHH family phosphoesterase [Candidatus Pacearchaeota archaeon]|nr:DHH family phosphoesterase [Candidatus Pacearchaeota archaeon]
MSIESKIKNVAEKFLEKSKDKEIYIVSHFDTDGISSAAIMIQALKKLDKKFSLKIVKNLDEEFIKKIPKNKLILFLDLASGSLNHIKNSELTDVFIIDHHEIPNPDLLPENIEIINPELLDKQKISASGLVYLFCKQLNPKNKEFAKLAVLGMIGDTLEKEIENLNHDILNDSEVKRKRGLLIYPSTRPLNRVLEYSSNPFIPGVTGDTKGVLELLRETGLSPANGRYKSLIELNEEEMEKLVTAIMLRKPKKQNRKIIGDIFLIKFFNKLEDARELSAIVNACSRLGRSDVALQFCMEFQNAKKDAELIHARYKQHIISGLKFASQTEKISGNGFVIINAQNNIKDTIAGTITSILSNSQLYEHGTILTTMAHTEDKEKIKVSSRIVGNGRNVREVLNNVIEILGEGEVGGHECAAGCVISRNQEEDFIKNLKKNLEIEVVKV